MRQRIWVKHHLKIIPSLCFSRNLAKNPSLAPLSWCPKLECVRMKVNLNLFPPPQVLSPHTSKIPGVIKAFDDVLLEVLIGGNVFPDMSQQ